MRGDVVRWDEGRGYGFIKRDDNGPDIFVHHKGLTMDGQRNLEDGQRVEPRVRQWDHGHVQRRDQQRQDCLEVNFRQLSHLYSRAGEKTERRAARDAELGAAYCLRCPLALQSRPCKAN